MSYHVNFLDNQAVTAEGLNEITEALGGVKTSFSDGVTYGVDDLNAISGELIYKGVSWGCEVSIVNGQAMIGTGVLFMGDGKRVTIDAEGVLLSFEAGMEHVVWFEHNKTMGVVVPRCTTHQPEGEDYVCLATITAEAEVVQKPDRAVMKNSHLGLNFSHRASVMVSMEEADYEEVLVGEIHPEHVGCCFVIVSSEEDIYSRHNFFSGYVDLKTGKSFGVHATTPGSVSQLDWGVGFGSETDGKLQVGFGLCERKIYKVFLRFSLDADNVLRIYKSIELAHVSDGFNLPSFQEFQLILC